MKIPFNRPSLTGNEFKYVKQAVASKKISGDGVFTKKCHQFLEKKLKAKKVLLTTSGTHALEMAAILSDLKNGDEVILPSFTFPSTVNAIVLRGAKPVFIDIRKDAKNIDESLIEKKITKKTKVIMPVHYGGVACEMDEIKKIAKKHKLFIIEDAAHALNAKYKHKYLGTLGAFGCLSFHETKNISCGEGGALIINRKKFISQAEIIREKGTNRNKFFRGEIDKYTWVSVGSSYLPSDILAAFLYSQLEKIDLIQKARSRIYNRYYEGLTDLEKKGFIQLPLIPKNCETNFHLFYILLDNQKQRAKLINYLKRSGILTIFHYIPLHTSLMGRKFGYKRGDLPITENVSQRLLRLPLYNSMSAHDQEFVIEKIYEFFRK